MEAEELEEKAERQEQASPSDDEAAVVRAPTDPPRRGKKRRSRVDVRAERHDVTDGDADEDMHEPADLKRPPRDWLSIAICVAGMLLSFFGVLMTLDYWLWFRTTVGDVYDTGLQQDRLIGVIIGIAATAAGAKLWTAGETASPNRPVWVGRDHGAEGPRRP